MKPERIVIITGILAMSCLPDTGGVDPPLDEFIYPVGLAAVPSSTSGETSGSLLVANSNFDLRYNSGTLVLLDLGKWGKFDKRGRFKAVPSEGEASADGKYWFVDESHWIKENETIKLGAFASDLALAPSHPMTPNKTQVLVPVRGERAVIVVDVDASKRDNVLECGEGSDLRCDGAHRVESTDTKTMPIEPYEVGALLREEKQGQGKVYRTYGFATHLAGGEVSLFHISSSDGDDKVELVEVVGDVIDGASGLAVNQARRELYVTGRRHSKPELMVLQLLTASNGLSSRNNPYFGKTDRINMDIYGGTDARGVAVSSDGKYAYVVTRTPSALIKVAAENRQMVDLTTVGADPSIVELIETPTATYAFVLCFLAAQVFIIDVDMMELLAVRETGSGPQAMAFDRDRELAYIANFRESTISVIQSTPPFDHIKDTEGRIVKLGRPSLPKGHN